MIVPKSRPKLWILIVAICALIFVFFPTNDTVTFADDYTQQEIEEGLQDNVNSQLGDLDFDSIEDVLNALSSSQSSLFGSGSFLDKIRAILSGEFTEGSKSVWGAILALLLDNLVGLLPLMSSVVAIAIFGGMLQGLKPSGAKSISNVINFVTYGLIVTLLLTCTAQMVTSVSAVIRSLKAQMDALFPILLTLMTALGGTISASVYQPAMALLSGAIMNIFSYILLPIFIFAIVFSVVSNLSTTVKLNKFTSFFESLFKWLMGLVFTIFTAFLSIQGITAGAIDGISIRTAKYAIKSYVPILGGYLADGLSLILASSTLIKNAVGGAGLLLLVSTIISPLLQLIIFMLALKLIAAIVEPLGGSQIANFATSLAKGMTLLISLILAVAFIYFLVLSLVICTANVV